MCRNTINSVQKVVYAIKPNRSFSVRHVASCLLSIYELKESIIIKTHELRKPKNTHTL